MIPVLVNDVPIDCINHAAVVYHVPAIVILSIMKKENGKNGDANLNKNGTIDYGVMQINSLWLPKIAPYGYTKDDLQFNACKNVEVAAWIIAQNIPSGKSLWAGIASYHSRTPSHNMPYKNSVYMNYTKLINVIAS
jgi:soluble lytic murein transglycosylase-like protein